MSILATVQRSNGAATHDAETNDDRKSQAGFAYSHPPGLAEAYAAHSFAVRSLMLASGHVIVRAAVFDEQAPALSDALAMLNEEERSRANAFRFARDRASYIAAHWLLRNLLSTVVHAGAARPHQWTFTKTGSGKPQLTPGQIEADVRFNVSHTRGMAVVAIGRDVDVGIDVEKVDRYLADHMLIAEKNFARPEFALLSGIADPAQRKSAFFDLWTAKEAFVKANGYGLSLPLNSFCVDLEQNCYVATSLSRQFQAQSWTLQRWQMPQHRIALAVASASPCSPSQIDACLSDEPIVTLAAAGTGHSLLY